MGHAHSHDAFAAVLPAAKASQSGPKPAKSGTSSVAAVGASISFSPGPKSLAANETEAAVPVPKELASASSMRIQPPAHALLLQDDPPLSSSRSSSCGDDGGLTHRECDGESSDITDSRFLIPESVRKSRTLDEFADVCSEILPNFLFVSNLQVATNAQKLKELGITHIVDCCKELEPSSALAAGDTDQSAIKVLNLALRDDTKEDLSWFFYQVIEFIQAAGAARSPPNKVLVHCHQGISRSCAFVVAFIMYQQQQQQSQQQSPTSFRDALAFVKAKRPIASPNTAFLCQLIEWKRELATFSSSSSSSLPHLEATVGLYRLAPHAAHDPSTLVLKSCYKPGFQRQRLLVAAAGGGRGSYSRWLFTRGVFVFMQPLKSQSNCEIVIWRGRKCEIPNGVALAKALVAQMVRVRLGRRRTTDAEERGELARLGIEIVEAREEEEDQKMGGREDTQIDHFGYAEELDWLKTSNNRSATSDPNNSVIPNSNSVLNTQELQTVTTEMADATIIESLHSNSPPLLFILEEVNDVGGSWDQLREYDSEDLTPSDAFLLVQPSTSRHFLWIGPEHTAFTPETLEKCAQTHVKTLLCGSTSGAPRGEGDSGALSINIKSEKGGEESDAFWAAFESGY